VALFAAAHVGQHRRDAVQYAFDVDIDHAIPLVDLEQIQGRQRHETRVVHQYVNSTVALERGVRQPSYLRAIGHVRDSIGDGTAGLLNFVAHRAQSIFAARGQHQLRAPLRQQPRGGLAETTAGAGDDHDFVLNIGH
jgi:hypothetical protein